MSPYGATPAKAPRETLASTSYSNRVTVHHVTKSTCPAELIEILFTEFESTLEAGRTYPQEGPIGVEGFRDYFFAGDVFVGIIVPEGVEVGEVPKDVESARAGRDWSECVAGCYYVCISSKHSLVFEERSNSRSNLHYLCSFPGERQLSRTLISRKLPFPSIRPYRVRSLAHFQPHT